MGGMALLFSPCDLSVYPSTQQAFVQCRGVTELMQGKPTFLFCYFRIYVTFQKD